jgi:hypothetical protein
MPGLPDWSRAGLRTDTKWDQDAFAPLLRCRFIRLFPFARSPSVRSFSVLFLSDSIFASKSVQQVRNVLLKRDLHDDQRGRHKSALPTIELGER